MKALHDLVQTGKVRYIGASSMWTWQLAHYNHVADKVRLCIMRNVCPVKHRDLTYASPQNGWTKFISMQNQYSLTYREEEREMNAYCNFHGLGLIPWGPLNAGQLARPLDAQQESERAKATKGSVFDRKTSEWEDEIVKRVEKTAKEKGWTMGQVAIAWINGKVTSPIVGFSSVSLLLIVECVCLRNSDRLRLTGQAHGGSDYPWLQAQRGGDQAPRGAVPATEHSRSSVSYHVAQTESVYYGTDNVPYK
jgi:aryl-alcohol dehydrogenase-like predicted oxidoreductase